MQKKLNEQDIAVDDFLADIGVEYSAALIGQTRREDWDCDAWKVTFRKDGKDITQDYYTGLGHRQSADKMPPDIARLGPRILARVEWERRYIKPVTPTAASVLHCLLLDSQAAHESFNDWCDNFGYDNDSMKAFQTYQACCETGKKLSQVFTSNQLNILSELLEDY